MTAPNPRCTVVIPTYNCGGYLRAALDSVVAQGVDGLEVIIVDDGSTDDSAEILAEAARSVPGLRGMRVERTKQIGPGLARNLAIELARAPLIAFLDADDVWLPGKMAPQIAAHEVDPNLVLSFTDYRHRGMDGEDRGTCFEFWGHEVAPGFNVLPRAESKLLGCNLVGTSTVVASRAALLDIGCFAGALPSSEDWDVWLKLARWGAVARSGMVGCDYLMRPNSVTAARARRIEAMELILARALEGPCAPERSDIKLAQARIATAQAEHDREQGHALRAVFGHAQAFALAPSVRALRATGADLVSWALRPFVGAATRQA